MTESIRTVFSAREYRLVVHPAIVENKTRSCPGLPDMSSRQLMQYNMLSRCISQSDRPRKVCLAGIGNGPPFVESGKRGSGSHMFLCMVSRLASSSGRLCSDPALPLQSRTEILAETRCQQRRADTRWRLARVEKCLRDISCKRLYAMQCPRGTQRNQWRPHART